MISAISPRGEAVFQIVEGSINVGGRFREFPVTLIGKSVRSDHGSWQYEQDAPVRRR